MDELSRSLRLLIYSTAHVVNVVGKVAFKKDLTNTLELAKRLDNPQEKFKSIHVAGTNGQRIYFSHDCFRVAVCWL